MSGEGCTGADEVDPGLGCGPGENPVELSSRVVQEVLVGGGQPRGKLDAGLCGQRPRE